MSQKAHEIFEAFLNHEKSRYTSTKRDIADAIFKKTHHFEVETFIDTFEKEDLKLSRASVYRTIKQLLDAGLLQKIPTQDGKVYYEHSLPQSHHAHIICNTCGKIFEIKNNAIESEIQKFCQDIHITPTYQSLHIYGDCQKKETCKNNRP